MRGSAAATDLRVGMRLYMVQGEDMTDKGIAHAGAALKAAGRPPTVTFLRPGAAPPSSVSRTILAGLSGLRIPSER